jgi:dual specificity MAP kinase phosphatase
VYVGPQIGRWGQQRLWRLGIRASVNLRVEFDDVIAGVAFPEHLRLPTVDNEAPTLEHLAAGVAFIERVVAAGGRVYVHCQSGVGRAPTLAVAYLVSTGCELAEALSCMQRVRPFVALTPPQQVQLARFAEWWQATSANQALRRTRGA